jgi:hypothetical protein
LVRQVLGRYFTAKQKAVKKMKGSQSGEGIASDWLIAPAHPMSANQIVRDFKSAIEHVECSPGSSLSQRQLAKICGAGKSTINDWLYGDSASQIHRFICSWSAFRSRIVSAFCAESAGTARDSNIQDSPTIRRR